MSFYPTTVLSMLGRENCSTPKSESDIRKRERRGKRFPVLLSLLHTGGRAFQRSKQQRSGKERGKTHNQSPFASNNKLDVGKHWKERKEKRTDGQTVVGRNRKGGFPSSPPRSFPFFAYSKPMKKGGGGSAEIADVLLNPGIKCKAWDENLELGYIGKTPPWKRGLR